MNMQCDKCQTKKATVHLRRKIDSNAWAETHLCEECFRQNRELNPGYQGLMVDERCSGENWQFSYAWGPGHRAETVRVESISPERMALRVVGSSLPEDWVFLLERMPGPWRKWPVGKEVQLSLSQAAFEWLQGKRESYEGFC